MESPHINIRSLTLLDRSDDLGLVHMNGRIYDPLLGRFLSADLVVQAPGDLQSYNRYSYVRNNPLSLTDPSGFNWFSDTVQSVSDFAIGIGAGAFEANDPTGVVTRSLDSAPASRSAEVGRVTGNLLGVVQGGVETMLGGGMVTTGFGMAGVGVAGGVITSPTGVGVVAGGAAVAAGAAVATAGTVVAAHGTAVAVNGGVKALRNLERLNKSDVKTGSDGGKVSKEPPNTLKENKAKGDAWEKQVVEKELPKTQTDIEKQITVKPNGTDTGNVRLDAVGKDAQTSQIKLTDAKASETAPLTKNQGPGYKAIEQNGGTVVGEGKGGYPGGTEIPPTKVDIIRRKPDGTPY
jgi:RHS repeat-associated protein